MAQNRGKQRGMVQVATSVILAAVAALLALSGCSSDGAADAQENLGQTREALTCGLTVCAADTDCIVHSCVLTSCVAKQLADGTSCGTRAAPGQCNAGVCCSGCLAPVKGGGYTCQKGTAVTQCGDQGNNCVNCNRGNGCETYSCTAGACDPPVVLPDKTTCTGGACWGGACCTGCIDGNKQCQPGTDPSACGDSANGLVACGSCLDQDPCTTDSCTNKACSNPTAPDTTPCVDGDKCNGDEACKSGKCVGPANFTCDDNNACTAESCDAQSGCAHAKLTGTSCADANKCNGDEVCSSGSCKAGTALDCNDNNVCTTDSCSAATGCVNTKQNGTSCADANKCNGAEMCVAGVCTAGTAPDCDDKNPCTDDSCDPAGGCIHAAVAGGTKCETDNNVCNGISTCMGSVCMPGTALSCDDGNVCTDDSCVPASGCKFVNNTADCSDNNLCTQDDKCSSGACKGGAAPNCDDNEACTTDSCDSGKGCVHAATNEGGMCDDGNGCSTGDKCVAGKCKASGGKVCDDMNACTQNACDVSSPTQTCSYPKETDGTPCSFDKCHQNSTCTSGACSQGDVINCDDANPCTTDTCDAATGCKHVADNTATCSDGDLCTTTDHCKSGVCVGTDVTCAPLDECHDAGTCSAKNGVCDDPRSADGKQCKGGHCDTGKCIPDPVGAGGEGGMGAGGEGTAGSVAAGGEPPVTGTAGTGNEPTIGGEPATEPTGGKAGSKASGGSTAQDGGAPGEDVRVFVRNPGGCSCSVPESQPGNLAWLSGLALVGALLRRRRARAGVTAQNRPVS